MAATAQRWGVRLALLTAFGVSGLAGLAYQITWSRMLGRSFGATAPAIATVLAVFMGGLGLGALLAGRRAGRLAPSRALYAYALVEVAVAAAGLAAPTLLLASSDAYAALGALIGTGGAARALSRAAVALFALGPPTFLMGTSLPLLTRALDVLATGTARPVGVLQAVNVGGALLGSYLTGLVLLPALGDTATTRIAAAASLLAAALGAAVAGRLRHHAAPAAPADARGARPPLALLATSAATGGLVLGFEVVWTRALVPMLGGSVFAFSAVLGSVLVGLAAGAWLAALVGERVRDPERAFVRLAWLAAFGAIAAFHLLPSLVPYAVRLWDDATPEWARALVLPALLAAVLVLASTVASGLAFPIGVRAASARGGVTSAAGWLLAANTLGGIGGALGAGLFGLGALGLRGTAIALAALGGGVPIVAALVARRGPARARWGAASFGVVALALAAATVPALDVRVFASALHMLPPRMRERIAREGIDARTATGRLLYAAEGAETVVFVEEVRGVRSISIGGKPVASSDALDLRNQYLLGHLPALLHGGPRDALVVGLGAGTTAGALALHATTLDVCELSEEVVAGARLFADLNHGVVDRANVRVHVEDGRTFLRTRPQRYDVISGDPIHPSVAGAAALYTEDYFRLVRSRLRPGGVAAHWLPLYQLAWQDVHAVLRAWQRAFPAATVHLAGMDAVLIGHAGDATRPFGRASSFDLDRAPAAARADLARIHLDDAARVAATAWLGPEELAALTRGARPLRDDHNWLELSAPRNAHRGGPEPLGRLLAAGVSSVDGATEAERRARASYGAVLRDIHLAWSGAPVATRWALAQDALRRDPASSELRARALELGVALDASR